MSRIGCVLLLVMTGCIVGDQGEVNTDKHAVANVQGTPGNFVIGSARFTLSDGVVSVLVELGNAPEGTHGFHIHQNPACGNNGMDAGGHWDGADAAGDPMTHGLPDAVTNHYGDIGNITIAADGTGTLTATREQWTLGDGAASDVINHSVIFHVNPDDGTMASAGARLGCGIIAAE